LRVRQSAQEANRTYERQAFGRFGEVNAAFLDPTMNGSGTDAAELDRFI
jgi:hypothetical protein